MALTAIYTPLCGCVTDGTSSICVEIEIAWLDMEHMDLNILNTYFKKKKTWDDWLYHHSEGKEIS